MMRDVAIAGVGFAVLSVSLATRAADDLVVKIGHVAPLSGPQARYGRDSENGVRMAIEDMNAKGVTIGGKKVKLEILPEDDAADPQQGRAAAQKLCDAKVAGVVGHMNSGTTIAASKIYHDCGIPHITGAALNPALTKPGYETTFRIIPNGNTPGAALALYAADKLNVKKVAVIDDRTAYGQGVAESFSKSARSLGMQVVDKGVTNDKATDFKAILTSIKAKQPDAIFYGGGDAQGGPMLRQMEQLGMTNVRLFGGDRICTTEIIKLADGAKTLDNVVCAEAGTSLANVPGEEGWRKRYEEKYPGQFQSYSPYTYDATFVLVDAMQRAGSSDPQKFLREIPKTNLRGITGPIAFEPNGELATASVPVYRYLDREATSAQYRKVEMSRQAIAVARGAQVVTMFFGTDRNVNPSAPAWPQRYSSQRAPDGKLTFGVALVTIPNSHMIGHLERPLDVGWFGRGKEDPNKHVVLVSADPMSVDEFFRRLSETAGSDRRAFVFVHGYAVPFEDAALRTAQLAVDLEIRAVPLFFSWPSQGNKALYSVDWTNIEVSQAHFRQFMERIADSKEFDEIYVIAHSMGSNAAAKGLGELLSDRKDLRPKFKELILAAADVDAQVFKEQILPRFRQWKVPLTSYASSRDKALRASALEWVHGASRLGMAGTNLVVDAGLETIDASNIDTDFLGHSTFAEDRSLLTDLTLLLKNRMRASERPSLKEDHQSGMRYWKFKQ